ncbi:Pyridoxal kinase [Dirofilaria immitis]|nr:Pyridoxal kinase [Dirofilaria immitis]
MENKISDIVYEQIKNNPSGYRRILSIQSHVIHGYAGNKCSVFPMQLHGYEVDPINSVQFSNHSAYKLMKGQVMDGAQLSDIYEGLRLNEINNYSHILTGYCRDASFLHEVINIVKDLKQKNPDVLFVRIYSFLLSGVLHQDFIIIIIIVPNSGGSWYSYDYKRKLCLCINCDPVLGDNGHYYVPKELMPIYRDILIPLADLITPNIFELSELSGLSVNNEHECLQAIDLMHKSGVKTVVVSSGLETATTKFCYGSVYRGPNERALQYRFDIPTLPGAFVGTGDVFISLLLVWMDKLNGDIVMAIQNVIGTLQRILQRTTNKAYYQRNPKEYNPTSEELELQLLQSRLDILAPQVSIKSTKL